jgi:hypothetical protein
MLDSRQKLISLGFAFYLEGEISLPFFGLSCLYHEEEEGRRAGLTLPEMEKRKAGQGGWAGAGLH